MRNFPFCELPGSICKVHLPSHGCVLRLKDAFPFLIHKGDQQGQAFHSTVLSRSFVHRINSKMHLQCLSLTGFIHGNSFFSFVPSSLVFLLCSLEVPGRMRLLETSFSSCYPLFNHGCSQSFSKFGDDNTNICSIFVWVDLSFLIPLYWCAPTLKYNHSMNNLICLVCNFIEIRMTCLFFPSPIKNESSSSFCVSQLGVEQKNQRNYKFQRNSILGSHSKPSFAHYLDMIFHASFPKFQISFSASLTGQLEY